jgi:riboflavin kinase / FMN adenylyltransferase
MQIFSSLQTASAPDAYLAIGAFDGVHRGHRLLLERMCAAARAADAPAAVLTFHPHPRLVLGADPDFRYLSTIDERLDQFRGFGLDAAILQPFDADFASLSASDFADRLVRDLGVRALWVGEGFAFGNQREGDISFLEQYGRQRGFTVEVVPPLTLDGEPVSSSRIRKALGAGDVESAATSLGRPYMLSGEVTHGDRRGRTLGTPTANIAPAAHIMIPANGIYATRVWAAGEWRGSVTNVGVRPTFAAEQLEAPLVEAHLFDFEGDLYGQTVRLEFTRRLRDELRFSDREALRSQIRDDILAARRIWEEQR